MGLIYDLQWSGPLYIDVMLSNKAMRLREFTRSGYRRPYRVVLS